MKQKLFMILAAGAGFAAGYYICYVKTRKVVEAEIADMMQYVEKKKGSVTAIKPDINEKEESTNDPAKTAEKIMKDNHYILQEEKEEERAMRTAPIDDEIYLIDEDQYNEEHHEFDKIEVTYYQKDGTYVDPNGDLVVAPQDVFSDLMEVIADQGIDGESFYIRNTDVAADFEVKIRNQSYAEAMGEVEANDDR